MYCIVFSVVILLQMFLSDATSCDCDLLQPLYKSLQCKSYCRRGSCITKYDCSESPYLSGVHINQCYYNGKHYKLGYILQERYPDYSGRKLCRYICTSSPEGMFFSNFDCVEDDRLEYPATECTYEALYNQDIYKQFYAPIYKNHHGRLNHCPYSWIKYELIEYHSDICTQKKHCCQFGNIHVGKYKKFLLPNSNVTCVCNCPPFVECIDYSLL